MNFDWEYDWSVVSSKWFTRLLMSIFLNFLQRDRDDINLYVRELQREIYSAVQLILCCESTNDQTSYLHFQVTRLHSFAINAPIWICVTDCTFQCTLSVCTGCGECVSGGSYIWWTQSFLWLQPNELSSYLTLCNSIQLLDSRFIYLVCSLKLPIIS